MSKKTYEWFGRYALPIALGTVSALVMANVSYKLYGNLILSAFLATLADAIVGYGIIIYKDLKEMKLADGKITFKSFAVVFRNMVLEFGPASYLDSYVFRPLFFSIYPLFIESYTLAILLGSLTAEITYLIPVIVSYEMRKKYL